MLVFDRMCPLTVSSISHICRSHSFGQTSGCPSCNAFAVCLRCSTEYTSASHEKRPRVHKFFDAWPEALFFFAVILQLRFLLRILRRVAFQLTCFVLPETRLVCLFERILVGK
jgi:hypothetical protein